MDAERWQLIESLVEGALAVPAGEARAAWLAAECGGDATLLAEVESLVEADERAAEFLGGPAFAKVARLLASDDGQGRAGQEVGHYRLVEEIGRGGMGVVYLAERVGGEFRQRAAVKLVRRGLDTEDILRRFRNERQILASLSHPNIARLLDGGTAEDGTPYFVMEYVEGEPLAEYCDGRGLSTAGRLRLFQTVCAAVSHAHQNLVVHRDIKPSNILVTNEGEPKLLDFGVAKFLNPELVGAARTRTRFRVLTPEYASPEQVRGQNVTTASDIYSLGVVLYELLTGARPYRLKDTSPEEMARAICDAEPTKPSHAVADRGSRDAGSSGDERSSNGERVSSEDGPSSPQSAVRNPKSLRGDLDNIILMALRKEPERRYKSVDQFSEDIRRHLEGLPVLARKDTFGYRASKFVARHKVGVAAAAAVLVALVAGLAATAWQARVAARERDQARREQAKAEQLNKFLQSILSAASPEQKGKDAKVIEVLNDAAARVQTEFADQPALKAQALLTIGETYSRISLLKEAEGALREALALNEKLYGEENGATALNMIYLGGTLLDEAKFGEAEPLLVKAVETERRLSPAGSKDLAAALDGLGEFYVRTHKFEQAKNPLGESVSMSEKLSGAPNEDSAYALVSLGRAQMFSGDAAAAESSFRKAIAVYRGMPGRYENRLSAALLNLGSLLTAKGNFDEGVGAMREAVGLLTKQGDSFDLSEGEDYLCSAYANHRDYAYAIEACGTAIEVGRKARVEDTPDFIASLDYLGLSLTRTGRAKEAEPALRESFDRAKKNYPGADVRTPLIAGALGECLTAQGRFAEAEPLVTQSYDAIKAGQGDKSPLTALASRRAADLYDKWKKPDLAAKYRTQTPQS